MPSLPQLKRFMKNALHQRKYQNLFYLPDGIHFQLKCLQKSNKNFVIEMEKIFKDWDKLKGREYDWLKSKERFLNALKGSAFFTVCKKEGSVYTCKFNSPHEVADKKAKKKQKVIHDPRRSGSDRESFERSPRTSPRSSSPLDMLQTKQDELNYSDSSSSSSNAIVAAEITKKTSEIAYPSSTLNAPAFPYSALSEVQRYILCTVVINPISTNTGSNSILSPEFMSVDAHTKVKDLNKSMEKENTVPFVNNVEVVPEKSGLNTPVFTGVSGNADLGGKTFPTLQYTTADVAKDLSNTVGMQNDMPSPDNTDVVPDNYPVSTMMKESCSHSCHQTPQAVLLTAPSTPINTLDIPPKSKTLSEMEAKWNNLYRNSTDPEEETLNASVDAGDESAESWTSATLTRESSPLEAPLGYGVLDVSQDIMNTPLFSEYLNHLPKKLCDYSVAGGLTLMSALNATHSLSDDQSPDIQGINWGQLETPLEPPPVKITVDHNAVISSNEVFSEGRIEDDMDISDSELNVEATEEVNEKLTELMNNVYEKMVAASSAKCESSEALRVPLAKRKTEGTFHTGNIETNEPHQTPCIYVNNAEEVNSTLEAISRSPGYATMLFPIEQPSHSGNAISTVALGNCNPSLPFAVSSDCVVLDCLLQFVQAPTGQP